MHRGVADFDASEILHHKIEEASALFLTERCREVLQGCELVIGEAKRLHRVRAGSSLGCSLPRAMARSRRSRKRASIRMSCSCVHPPTTSSPGCDGASRQLR